jgi:glutamate transport system permease protein
MTGFEPYTEPAIWRFLLIGLVTTLQAAMLGIGLSLVVGTIVAAGRVSGQWPLAIPATVFAQVFRSLPSYLILLTVFFGLHALGMQMSPLMAIAVGLAVYHGAKVSEIIRGSVQSVERVQIETARSIGLTRWQTLVHVLWPQAFRRMQPALVSELILCVKNTSLGPLVGLDELVRRGEIVYQKYVNPIETFVVIGALFWVMCFSLSRLSHYLEARYAAGAGRAVPTVRADFPSA